MGKSAISSQSGGIEFFRRVHGVTVRGRVRYREFRGILNIYPLLQIEISATMIRPRDQKGPGKVGVSCPAGNT